MRQLILRKQEPPLNAAASCCQFQPTDDKPFLATPGALSVFEPLQIIQGLQQLQSLARQHNGIDYLQVFEDEQTGERLWFIEDGEGGAITALLPSEY